MANKEAEERKKEKSSVTWQQQTTQQQKMGERIQRSLQSSQRQNCVHRDRHKKERKRRERERERDNSAAFLSVVICNGRLHIYRCDRRLVITPLLMPFWSQCAIPPCKIICSPPPPQVFLFFIFGVGGGGGGGDRSASFLSSYV